MKRQFQASHETTGGYLVVREVPNGQGVDVVKRGTLLNGGNLQVRYDDVPELIVMLQAALAARAARGSS